VQPIVRDFPLATMRPGDVYFHNDVYGSEGGIGHLPDLCVTLPVFHADDVVAFVQVFGHHDDIGGAVPGSMPSHATSAYQEGLIVPPVKLYDAGRPNTDVIKIMVRNSRLPDSLRGDLDSEVAACRLGAERLTDLFGRYWPRPGRGVLRRHPRPHRGHLQARAAEQDSRGNVRVGGLRRA
jgi:N-methylhydantoinase B